jgi:hypothetical protein
MLTGQAPEGGPIGDPFDFHGEPYLLPPQYDACKAPLATFSLFYIFARLLSYDERKSGDEHGKQYTHLEWWRAYYHFVRPHEALRVALAPPRERGGKKVAQRYRQRTPAMAADRTTRVWTAREVLSCPLPLVST